MTYKPKIVIIGAGPCGLGAAWRLKELGFTDFLIFDKNSYPGGTAASFTDNSNFVWDIGAHVVHSHYDYFDQFIDFVLKSEYDTFIRRSAVWLFDNYLPYPLQNNLHQLPVKVMQECMEGLKQAARKKTVPANFAEWLQKTYGKGLAKYFLFPYNRKAWLIDLTRLSTVWVGDRVAPVDIKELEKNINRNKDDVDWGPNYHFKYPKKGGAGVVWKKLGDFIQRHLRLNMTVSAVDTQNKTITFKDKTQEKYDLLLTTLPLVHFLELSKESKKSSKDFPLKWSKIHLIGVGVKGKLPRELLKKSWIYFSDKSVPFFRVTIQSNFSPANTPQGFWSILAEISSVPTMQNPKLKQQTLQALEKIGLLVDKKFIVNIWEKEIPFGYPIPTLGRDKYLNEVLPSLEKKYIFSRGRFGLWKYEVSNQDHTFMQGVEWVNRMLLGQAETTKDNRIPKKNNS